MEILRGGNFRVFHDYGLIGEIFPMRKYHPNDIDTEIALKSENYTHMKRWIFLLNFPQAKIIMFTVIENLYYPQ